MSEIKFAKGEWVAKDNGYYFDVHEVDESGCYLDQVCMGVSYENKEKAYLIATAAEMYVMLEKVAQAQKDAHNEIDHSDSLYNLYGDIELLLAKARGE